MHETRARTIKLTVAIIIILGFIYKRTSVAVNNLLFISHFSLLSY